MPESLETPQPNQANATNAKRHTFYLLIEGYTNRQLKGPDVQGTEVTPAASAPARSLNRFSEGTAVQPISTLAVHVLAQY